MNDCDQDDEPPPLEDMTEELEKMCRIGMAISPQAKPRKSEGSNIIDIHNAPGSTGEVSSDKVLGSSAGVSSDLNRKDRKIATDEEKGFGGFQKGFLFGSKPSKPSSSSNRKSKSIPSQGNGRSGQSLQVEDDIIRPKTTRNESALEFPEVQEAMKELNPMLATDKWLTDDFLSKVEEDPVLSKGFSDPIMMQYLNLLQTNPKQAFATAQGNPELQKFTQSFCALMGNHLSTLEAESSSGSTTSEPAIMSQEEAKVKKLTSNPEVRSVLLDPRIVRLMHLLKTDPPAAQRLIAESKSDDFNSKIDILLQNGLLSLQ